MKTLICATKKYSFYLALVLGFCGCSVGLDPYYGELGQPNVPDATGFNEQLRLDRMPLTDAQASTDPRTLIQGNYRQNSGDLVSPLVPVTVHAAHLPQSECLWYARSARGGRDFMRLHWEGVYEPNQDVEPFKSYRDDERIAACRINHPETRMPPRHKDADLTFEPYAASDGTWLEALQEAISDDENFPKANDDLAILLGRLTEIGAPLDTFRQCPGSDFAGDRRAISNGQSFFDGPSDELGNVSLCSPGGPQGGYRISPEQSEATRYEMLFEPVTESAPNPDADIDTHRTHRLGPALLAAEDGVSLARLGEPRVLDNKLRWQTAEISQGTLPRWEENFTEQIFVSQVRIFRYRDLQKTYLPLTGLQLCVKDRSAGVDGCRFRLQPGAVVGATPAFLPVINGPSPTMLTPTFAHDTAARQSLSAPLRWEVQFAAGEDLTDLYFEFTLETLFSDAGLSSRGLLALSPGRENTARSGSTEIRNFGRQPLRITRVSLRPGYRQSHEFSLMLPYAPQPMPLPVNLFLDGVTPTRFSLDSGYWSAPMLRSREIGRHILLQSDFPHGATIDYQGVLIRSAHGIALRPSADLLPKYVPDSSEQIRPLAKIVYAERRLPFDLAPGDSFDVRVVGVPRCCGVREGLVEVDAYSAVSGRALPRLGFLVRTEVFANPLLLAMPTTLTYPRPGSASGEGNQRRLLLTNVGGVDLQLIDAQVGLNSGYGQFVVVDNDVRGQFLQPGDVRTLRIDYAPPRCGAGIPQQGSAVGRIAIDSDGGSVSTELWASYSRCRL